MVWKIKDGQTIIEPVSLDELKTHLRVDNELEDLLIPSLGVTARQYIEKLTDQILIEQSVLVYFDKFPLLTDCLELPIYPIKSITHIKYLAEAETVLTNLTTWEVEKYRADLISRKARIAPISTESFPTALSEINAVEIELVAGFGDATKVPDIFKTAIKLIVGEMYEHRQNRVHKLPTTVMNLLKREMDFTFA